MRDKKGQVTAYITSYKGNTIQKETVTTAFVPDPVRENEIINLYPFARYQTLEGFGASLTEAACYTFSTMSEKSKKEFLADCFGEEGLHYNMARMALDSCDASLDNYSAMDDENDKELKSFSLERDEKYILPFYEAVTEARQKPLTVMLSPWSPPAFMKTNGEKNHGGKLKKEYYGMWAEYFCKYIQEYRAKGVDVKIISIQNEPNAVQTWDSCCYNGEEEKEFLKRYLYPALEKYGLDNLEIYIWDHNKERVVDRAREVIDEETSKMITGIAFHWYSGDHFEALKVVQDLFPDKKVAFTEGCVEYSKFTSDNHLANARMYAHDMIGNLNNGAVFLINWSILFNSQGGPNHVQNWCEAPVMYDEKTDTLEKKLSFEYIRHFSGYLPEGSVRIGLSRYTDEIEGTAALRPDGSIAVILMNRTDSQKNVYLRMDGETAGLVLPGDSIVTAVIG